MALLVQALIARDLHRTMAREQIDALPSYPEERTTRRPTAERILRLFSFVQRSRLHRNGRDVQLEVLNLLNVPRTAY